MLHSRKHGAPFFFTLIMVDLIKWLKIKYLRVPDTLLDAVKDEQARAREANRGARGGHASGPRGAQ